MCFLPQRGWEESGRGFAEMRSRARGSNASAGGLKTLSAMMSRRMGLGIAILQASRDILNLGFGEESSACRLDGTAVQLMHEIHNCYKR